MKYILPIIFVALWATIIFAGDWSVSTETQPGARYCTTVEVTYPMGQGVRTYFCVEGNDETPAPQTPREEV